jgi:4-oxalocrotonate tautomerase
MLILRLTMMEGRTEEQKRQLMERLSRAAGERFRIPLGDVRMMIHEVPALHWGVGGKPMSDRKTVADTKGEANDERG